MQMLKDLHLCAIKHKIMDINVAFLSFEFSNGAVSPPCYSYSQHVLTTTKMKILRKLEFGFYQAAESKQPFKLVNLYIISDDTEVLENSWTPTQSSYSAGKVAATSKTVLDIAQGERIVAAKVDNNGVFSIKVQFFLTRLN